MSTPVVYMMSDHQRQLLYVGATVDLARRAFEHRNGAIPGFTRRYGLFVLVYYEMHPDIGSALARERLIKHWPRKWPWLVGPLRLAQSLNRGDTKDPRVKPGEGKGGGGCELAAKAPLPSFRFPA